MQSAAAVVPVVPTPATLGLDEPPPHAATAPASAEDGHHHSASSQAVPASGCVDRWRSGSCGHDVVLRPSKTVVRKPLYDIGGNTA